MNFVDYLVWRGDLSLEKSEFNEVDNLILSYLAYVNLDGVAPGMGEVKVTIKEISNRFFEIHSEEELKKDRSFVRMAPHMMKDMAETVRFGNCRIGNYVNKIDAGRDMQFAALEIVLDDNSSYVSFRGTDDTIVGWKEDLNLSNGEVSAEREAMGYLNQVGAECEGYVLRVGGHSKGGNLAVYAATCCRPEIQNRISVVYNNDGPGFTAEFLGNTELQIIRPRIKRYIPESSVIGMLLEHVAEPIVIKSSQKGILQHDGFSWEVLGPKFLHCEQLSNSAIVMNQIISNWVNGLDRQGREQVISDLFEVLEAPGTETLTQLQENGLKNVPVMMKKIETMAPGSKVALENLFRDLLQHIPEFVRDR